MYLYSTHFFKDMTSLLFHLPTVYNSHVILQLINENNIKTGELYIHQTFLLSDFNIAETKLNNRRPNVLAIKQGKRDLGSQLANEVDSK